MNELKKVMFEDGIGYVSLVEVHGSEEFISEVAGISHDNPKGPSIEKLMQWGHLSPLEFAGMTFEVKMPIFVARQLMRHRTGKFMEKSLRYCEATPEFYNPAVGFAEEVFKSAYTLSMKAYKELVDDFGFHKEQARCILPLATYTTAYMQFDLRNLKHLIELRVDSHAQAETRWYAQQMLDMLREYFPNVGEGV